MAKYLIKRITITEHMVEAIDVDEALWKERWLPEDYEIYQTAEKKEIYDMVMGDDYLAKLTLVRTEERREF